MSRTDRPKVILFPMFIVLADRAGQGAMGMTKSTPRLRLTSVDPVDELAPIPISEARKPLAPEPRFDAIRMAEDALNRLDGNFNRLKLLLAEEMGSPDGGPDRAA